MTRLQTARTSEEADSLELDGDPELFTGKTRRGKPLQKREGGNGGTIAGVAHRTWFFNSCRRKLVTRK
jgi:hypothetical protein